MPENLGVAVKEFEEARRYQFVILAACAGFVELHAERGDELATGLARLLHDAEKRAQIARLTVTFAAPREEPPNR